MSKLDPVTPGELLSEEYLKPMGISRYRLAKEIGVPQRRIGEIVAGTRAVTADTGLRLSRFFGMSDGFWIGLQMDYDAAKTKDSLAKTLAKIKPWTRSKVHSGAGHRRGRRFHPQGLLRTPPGRATHRG